MLKGYEFPTLVQRVNEMQKAKHDPLGGTAGLTCYSFEGSTPVIKGLFPNDSSKDTGISKNARGQIADYIGCGRKYMTKMWEDAPGLAASNINHWFSENNDTKLFRCLDFGNDTQPTLRAFLSKGYIPFDSIDLLQAIQPVMQSLNTQSIKSGMPGLHVEASYLDYDGMTIKVFWPGKTASIKPGDTISAGLMIKTGETGLSSTQIIPMSLRAWCSNGCAHNVSTFSRTHVQLGSLSGYANVMSNETKAAGERAISLQVRDVAHHILQGEWLNGVARQFAMAEGIPVSRKDVEKHLELLPTDTTKELVLDEFFAAPEKTAFELVNAVTAVAHGRDVASMENAFALSTELETLGGQLLDTLTTAR